jgi:hypothetical protein
VIFAPRIEDQARHGITGLGRVVVQRGYQRSGGFWEPTPPRIGKRSRGSVGKCARIDFDRDPLFVRPHALVANRTTREVETMSLAEGWAPYFPDVPRGQAETFEYPPLFSHAFWQMYSEPLDELIHAASSFAVSVMSIQQSLSPDPHLPAEVEQALGESLSAEIARLNQWLGRASPAIVLEGDRELRSTWTGSSLLSMMAVLAHLDMTSRGRILHCSECNRVFFSMAATARYCSATCRQTTHTRTYRANKRARESTDRRSE